MNDSQWKGVFDLSDAEGSNPSERFLTELCRRSFLRLWSFPNTFTDEGMAGTKPSGKEFTDVLVIFGDDVILFSDKDIAFNSSIELSIAWPRWFKSAVEHSAKQLLGALNWAKRFPHRVFLDAACKRPLPIELPPSDRARYHLIATTRGSFAACGAAFPGSIGSHQINTGIEGAAHRSNPFTIGNLDPSKHFVHVFDEFSLELILRELDTASDFVGYLAKRRDLLASPTRTVIAAGEEQLLAAYLTNMADGEHAFLPRLEPNSGPNVIWFDESHFDGLLARPEYLAKKKADEISYLWDDLINKFIALGDPAIGGVEQENHQTERALRTIASESRFNRRLLSQALMGLLQAAADRPGKRRARIVASREQPDAAYIFIVEPRLPGESYEDYRLHRFRFLQLYCRCAKLRMPLANRFIGMAFDHPVKDYPGESEDLVIFEWGEFGDAQDAECKQIAKELGILGDGMQMHETPSWEFPQLKQKPTIEGRPQKRALSKKKNSVAKKSRRKNRRR